MRAGESKYLGCALLLASGLCLASAAAKPHWSRLDFTESTHHGVIRVLLTAEGMKEKRHLDSMTIWVDGRQLKMPHGVKLNVADPHLHDVSLSATGSYSCFDDVCPDISQWPAILILPYGETVNRSDALDPVTGTRPCEESFMSVDILADRIEEIELFICDDGREEHRVVFSQD